MRSLYLDGTPTFDAQVDPIVRVEVGRLRRELDHYYLTDGRAEPFRIAIPKGRYVAVWEALGRARSRYTHPWHLIHQSPVSALPAASAGPNADAAVA